MNALFVSKKFLLLSFLSPSEHQCPNCAWFLRFDRWAQKQQFHQRQCSFHREQASPSILQPSSNGDVWFAQSLYACWVVGPTFSLSAFRNLCDWKSVMLRINLIFLVRMWFTPELIKNGIRKRPDKTLSRKDCNVDPSKGKAPQTRTYKTTPSDYKESKDRIKFVVWLFFMHQVWRLTQISISGPVYFFPSNTSGAAYGGDPKNWKQLFDTSITDKTLNLHTAPRFQ